MRTGKSPTSCLAHGRCRFHFIMEFDGKTLTPKNVTPSVVYRWPSVDGGRVLDRLLRGELGQGRVEELRSLHPMLF